LEDPRRFRKSRDAGCYIGLQPGRRNSGQSEPQLHITREGDSYPRMVLVQGAQHILGPFGEDSDLRRWGLKLAERGGKRGKRRAIIAVARKLAVLLHHLWISCEAYEPLPRTIHPAHRKFESIQLEALIDSSNSNPHTISKKPRGTRIQRSVTTDTCPFRDSH
jgi:hypothetical protein